MRLTRAQHTRGLIKMHSECKVFILQWTFNTKQQNERNIYDFVLKINKIKLK